MFAKNKVMTQEPERNVMSKGTEINGDIVSQGDFRIDGSLKGTIKAAGKLIMGKDAKVDAVIDCANADVEGTFKGKIQCSGTLSIRSTANIEGEVYVDKLAIEPNAIFNATCYMKGVKSINTDDKANKKEAS